MRRIGFVFYPGFSVMSLAVASVFELADKEVGGGFYEMAMLSENGGSLCCSIGTRVETARLDDSALDTVIVSGGADGVPSQPGLSRRLEQAPQAYRRIAAICTGAFVLAEAGLLDGRRATTHWAFSRMLQSRFPAARVDDDRIFVIDGPIHTSAGMTAGIDLALAMVEEDLGRETARAVARKLVVYHRRSGGQSQFSALLELEPKTDRIQQAMDHAKRHLNEDLPVERLAAVANLSPRQFSRAFRAETGQSPAKAVERLRVEAARLMMEETRHPIDVIARQVGFNDGDRMRRAFLRAFGQPPQTMRRNSDDRAA